METETISKNEASLKSRKNQRNLLLVSLLCIVTLFLSSCGKEPDDSNNNNINDNSLVIDTKVINGNNYNDLVDEVRATYRIYEGEYELYTLLTAQYKDGGFKMTLPETLEPSTLQSIENMWEIGDELSISDRTTKICLLQTNFAAYKNDQFVDDLGYISVNMNKQWIGYVYVDKDCNVTGETTSGDLIKYEMYFKKGWNIVYFHIYKNAQEKEVEHLTTTKPNVNFAWYFSKDITWLDE